MYTPESFRIASTEECHAVMIERSFAILVTTIAEEAPAITHLPLIVDRTVGEYGALRGHLAKANDHWRAFVESAATVAIFQGPHGYISPRWYAAAVAVPTWNYIAVHAHGRPEIVTDADAIRRHLAELAVRHESGPNPWRVDELPADTYEKLSASIVCFSMRIERLEGKAKLGQNRSAADQAGMLAGLDALDTPAARELATVTRNWQDRQGVVAH